MKAIWKFTLSVSDTVTLDMPKGARVLSVAVQYGKPCLWAVVDPNADPKPRTFHLRGTGHPVPDDAEWRHVGTLLMNADTFVLHVFEDVPS